MELPINYDEAHWSIRKKARDQYVLEQENICWFCGCSLGEGPPNSVNTKKINWDLFPNNFLKYPIHLHHNHKTGMTIGAVHSFCNAVLWQYYGE